MKKPKPEGDYITLEDSGGTKKMIHGTIEGFTVKRAQKQGITSKQRIPSTIKGLDGSWADKRVLCILLEEE